MQQYPYSTPILLTDDVFLLYGGMTGTSTSAQRQAAYLLAEEQMTEHLSSFLVPTIITGTHFWRGNPLELEFGHVLNVFSITVASVDWNNFCTIDTASGCAVLRNAEYGYLDVSYALSCGACSSFLGLPPYNVQAVYESGLSTGTATSPTILSALAMAAQINLNEWDVSLSNEGTADIGVQRFVNQSYVEERKTLGNTVFGNSAMAQRIARLTKRYRSKPFVGFR